mmetsp:Transcript_3778/g.5942  ORF Transcript_3778/g.5942 Transcript_3778/m.5942 type:complete len:384 (-) Transcript_3778:18-1169(-)
MEQRLRAVRKEAEDAEAKKIEEARREATSEIQRQLADYKQSADSSRREHGRLLEEQTRRAAERERQLQDEIGEMRERMQHSETAEKRLLSVESELTEVKKAAEEARKQAHREASEREGKARLEMEKMQLKIDAAEAREREETRRLAVAQDTLAKEREAMRVKTHQQIATDQQKLEWKKREALLREEVLRLGESLKREHAESEQLRKGQQQLKESATNLAAKFQEKEARMQKNFEKMKARVKEKVQSRENELLSEIDSLKGHLKKALEMQKKTHDALEQSKAELQEMERQHIREELAWIELKRDLTEEETLRRETQTKQYEADKAVVQARITRETEASQAIETTRARLTSLQSQLSYPSRSFAGVAKTKSNEDVFALDTAGLSL